MNYVCSKFREELEKEGGHDVENRLEKEFPAWFRSHVSGSKFIFNFICSPALFFSYISIFHLFCCLIRSRCCGRIIMKRLVKGYMQYHVILTLE